MARDSRDAARLLSGITGRDDRAPLSWVEDPDIFMTLPERDPASIRLGWSEDVGGLPIDPEVRGVLREARRILEAAGVEFLDIEPDLSGADECWQAIEMFNFGADGKARFEEGRTGFRDDYVRNVAEGRALSADAYAAALAHRTVLFRRTAAALWGLDGIVYPATPVAAPSAEVEWVAEVDGTSFERYFLWQRAACRLTVTGHPVLATPAGFTGEGLPVGMQIVGASRGDAALLSVGAAVEDVLGHVGAVPTGVPA
jgi:amidase